MYIQPQYNCELTTGSVLGYALCLSFAVHCTLPPASICLFGAPHRLQNGLACNTNAAAYVSASKSLQACTRAFLTESCVQGR